MRSWLSRRAESRESVAPDGPRAAGRPLPRMSPGLRLPAKASSLIWPQGPADLDVARLTVAVVAGRLSPAGHRAARVRRFRGSQWLADWQGCGATPLPLPLPSASTSGHGGCGCARGRNQGGGAGLQAGTGGHSSPGTPASGPRVLARPGPSCAPGQAGVAPDHVAPLESHVKPPHVPPTSRPVRDFRARDAGSRCVRVLTSPPVL